MLNIFQFRYIRLLINFELGTFCVQLLLLKILIGKINKKFDIFIVLFKLLKNYVGVIILNSIKIPKFIS